MHKFTINPKFIPVVISIFVVCVFLWLFIAPPKFVRLVLKRLDYLAYDLRLNLLVAKKPIPKNPIVIVDIDEKSLAAEGRWPWSRDKIAALVEGLYQQGVTVIAFDILFPEAEPGKDEILANVLNTGKDKIALGAFFTRQQQYSAGQLPLPVITLSPEEEIHFSMDSAKSYTANIPLLVNASPHGGAISVTPDEDGVIRHYGLLQRYGENLYPSLALSAVALYLLENNISVETALIGKIKTVEALNFGNTHILTDGQTRIFIPYLGASRTFPYYSATDIMHGHLPKDQLQNALVFVGTSAVGLNDIRSTPVESVFPGVEIHANVAELCLLVFLGLILSFVFAFVGPLWIIITSLFAFLSVFFGSLWLWQSAQIVLPIALPEFLVIVLATFNMTYGFFTESRRKDELKKVFEQYVPAKHIDEIIKHHDEEDFFEGERKLMSVLFMDIRNFTTISEKLNIVDLKKLLNFFLTEMTSVIFKNGGTVDKYVGDMVMAFWGAPLEDVQHARHAIFSGLEMLKVTEQLQAKLAEMKLPPIHIGVGVNTGMMDVGDMGSSYRRAYTVLGDAVNLASRLESLTKYYGVGMICGEKTIELQTDFVFRLLDKVTVKGKHEGVSIYEPLGLRAEISDEKLRELTQYEEALQAYYAKQFINAKATFTILSVRYPDVLLYKMYLARIAIFAEVPPPPEWDGIWEHHEK